MEFTASELLDVRHLEMVQQWQQLPALANPTRPNLVRLKRILTDYETHIRYCLGRRIDLACSSPYADPYEWLDKLKAICEDIDLTIDAISAMPGAEHNATAGGTVAYLFSIATDLVKTIEWLEPLLNKLMDFELDRIFDEVAKQFRTKEKCK